MPIDQGQSRANMYYWTLFWNGVTNVKGVQSGDQVDYQITYKDGSTKVLN